MAFKYRPRSAEQWDRRANQRGSEFEGFVKEELKIFTPKKGGNAVRFLPPTFEEATHYAIDVYVHYSVGPNNASVLCLQNMRNQRCPICEARTKALKVGDEDQARELRAAKRSLCWIVDRNDEDKGAMLWAAPFTLDRAIAGIAKDRRTGKIYQLDDPDNGYDVFFDKVGEKMRTEYTGVQIDRNASSVNSKVMDYVERWPLPDCLIWRTYDEVYKLFSGDTEAPEEDRAHGTDSLSPTRTDTTPDDEEALPRRAPETVRRRLEPSNGEEALRRVAPSEEPVGRREEINNEVPWDPPPSTPPQPARTAADRLRERFRE